MQYQIIMKKYLILLVSLFAFASCSDKKSDEVIDATPIYVAYIQVVDSEGNDLLDINNENCIFDREYLRVGLLNDPLRIDFYSAEFNITETGSWYGTANEKLTENTGVGRLTIYPHDFDKYTICIWVPGFWPIIYHQFKITWRDGVGSDVINMEMGGYGTKSEFMIVNGVELKPMKKGSHAYMYTIVK